MADSAFAVRMACLIRGQKRRILGDHGVVAHLSASLVLGSFCRSQGKPRPHGQLRQNDFDVRYKLTTGIEPKQSGFMAALAGAGGYFVYKTVRIYQNKDSVQAVYKVRTAGIAVAGKLIADPPRPACSR